MSAVMIWSGAALVYALFWSWYVGFGRRCDPADVEHMTTLLHEHGFEPEHIAMLREFFLNDSGKSFVMVNLLDFAEPREESLNKLGRYQKVFLGSLLKRAGHPLHVGRAVAGNIENHGIAGADGWQATGLIRYRRRADLLALLPETIGSPHHRLKLEALSRTVAFPVETMIQPFGVTSGMALLCALVAALAHLALAS